MPCDRRCCIWMTSSLPPRTTRPQRAALPAVQGQVPPLVPLLRPGAHCGSVVLSAVAVGAPVRCHSPVLGVGTFLLCSLAPSPSPCDGPFCSPSSGSLEASERFRAEFDRIAAMVAPLSSTAVYSVLVSAFMARGAILFKLQSKVFQDMLSRGDLTYMGAVSRIADFRATVRVGWLAVPQHASLWFARVVGTSCFVRCWCWYFIFRLCLLRNTCAENRY